jgi:hypothetical protein
LWVQQSSPMQIFRIYDLHIINTITISLTAEQGLWHMNVLSLTAEQGLWYMNVLPVWIISFCARRCAQCVVADSDGIDLSCHAAFHAHKTSFCCHHLSDYSYLRHRCYWSFEYLNLSGEGFSHVVCCVLTRGSVAAWGPLWVGRAPQYRS